jgi:flagellin-like protein
MGKMKANRKFKEADERAVSAVIGVILMVAITVAIAATVYVYVSGMIGGTQKKTPTVSLIPDDTNNLFTVASADANIAWADITITAINNTGVTVTGLVNSGAGGKVIAGNTLSYATWINAHTGDTVRLTLMYIPTNSLIGTYQVS